MPHKPVKTEAKSCLKVLMALIGVRPGQRIPLLSDLFNTKEVDILRYKVIYPVPIEGFYWITPRQRDLRTFFVPPDTLICARFHPATNQVDVDFDYKSRAVVVTMKEQDFNIAAARMQLLDDNIHERN